MAFDFNEDDTSDDALLILFSNGDPMAARSLTARHLPRVLSQAKRMLQNEADAEDVAQEAMMRVWKIAPNWRQAEAKLSTWLYRVVANLCLDRLRKKSNIGLDQIDEPLDDQPEVSEKMVETERQIALHSALAELPERQRLAVTLRHIEGLSNPDIGEIMQISVEAVESLSARGKRGLIEILKSQKEKLGLV